MNTSGQDFCYMNIKVNHDLTWHCEATSVLVSPQIPPTRRGSGGLH